MLLIHCPYCNETLPEAEMRCGLGEMAKYHFLGGDDLAGLDLEDQIALCVGIKARVVADDEREAGRRAVLNYGHTLGHALEATGGYGLRHGEAVALPVDAQRHVVVHGDLVGESDAPRDDKRQVVP